MLFARLREDIACILARDPAARTAWEVLTCYPGLHALALHRWAHWCWRKGLPWLGRWVSHWSRFLTGIEIHPGARVGRRVFIDHGMGVVVGETAEIGDDCTIYQGVTLGGTSLARGTKRHPTLGKGVIVGANAQVLGGFVVGDGARVGSNAVVTKAVPEGATAVGNPARITTAKIIASHITAAKLPGQDGDGAEHDAPAARGSFSAYGVTDSDDPVSQAIKGLIGHASGHEHQIALLWQAVEKLAACAQSEMSSDCMPIDAHKTEAFDADALNRLVK
jgi:serine O-acetyltransferase